MAGAPPTTTNPTASSSFLPAKSYRHSVAGGLGGLCNCHNLFREKHTSVGVVGAGVVTLPQRSGGLLWNFVKTGHILRDIYRDESPRAFFKGLGPTLVGVIPAPAIAGIVTETATNPIWVVKTRLQLTTSERRHPSIASTNSGATAGPSRAIGGSFKMVKKIFREEGIKCFYKGLSASHLGVTEGTIQWVLYERLKPLSTNTEGRGGMVEWFGMLGSAGTAKCVVSLITYPHEYRFYGRDYDNRLNGVTKYTGLWQTLRTVIAEEGARSLYGGPSAHLMRIVPNAAVMYSIYEGILRWGKHSD
ncbi:mitochondrial carrier domain-containing protein [Suillus spraguei]|nr:mitochondrial carrier domain-containing protein [Suillus spraguei]